MDGTHVVIPNGDILNQHLVNWSMGSFRKRTSIKVGLAYGTDIEKQEPFKAILEETERILKTLPGRTGKKLWPLFNRI
jgi:small-conductance mechanosensitive channel